MSQTDSQNEAGIATRRGFLSSAAGVAAGGAALALATIPPASAATAPVGPGAAELRQAFDDMVSIDSAIARLFKRFGDDTDSRDDYAELEEKRNDCIATLIEVPAASMAGLLAKASALRLKVMIEDYDQHQKIAVSLADDLVLLGANAKLV